MNESRRKNFTGEFKTKVALKVIRDSMLLEQYFY